ncbi:hypothetical protein Atai01_56660 [Amycolatopsis taiwanensis]|uniref:DUF6760 domain-containing protein n=1 Tax=Amycolatopsis taiwanensis TaxID=342230 RepID=A0A9W6R7J2_9PSEU|nr:hypothetical protein Atai01_56660 [Amycolatopsis taiwanensis]
MPARVPGRAGRWSPGGILTYPSDRLYREVGYLAYHLHWSLDDLLDLEHPERLRFVDEVARINTRREQGV